MLRQRAHHLHTTRSWLEIKRILSKFGASGPEKHLFLVPISLQDVRKETAYKTCYMGNLKRNEGGWWLYRSHLSTVSRASTLGVTATGVDTRAHFSES